MMFCPISVNDNTTVGEVPPCSSAASTVNNQLQSVDDFEGFYRSECAQMGINVNNSFLKQLQSGKLVFNFDNGYLGERGIIPILMTLQRLPVAGLSLRGCKLSTEDIAQMQLKLYHHTTLQKIDLRDVQISVSAARRLSSLAATNTCLTEILLNEDTPKYLSIQRQCSSNANISLVASRCLVCGRAVIYSPDQRLEGQILLSITKALMYRGEKYCDDVLEMLFRILVKCCDCNNGVLFLCSCECRDALSDDIVAVIETALNGCQDSTKASYTRNTLLQHCLMDNIERMTRAQSRTGVSSSRSRVSGKTSTKTPVLRGALFFDSDSSESSDRSGVDGRSEFGACSSDVCSVCGITTTCLTDGAYRFLNQIYKDVALDSYLRPSALLHLSRVVIKHGPIRPCSQECVEHLARFCLYSYGGVHPRNGRTGVKLLSSLDVPLGQLTNDNFAIVNFASVHVDDMHEEDTCCALTVASAMSDIEGEVIDPYMIYAVGRYLAKCTPNVLGMELRHACDAALLVGCVPVCVSPFDRRKERPRRDLYLSWEKWSSVADVESLIRIAFSRRRQGLYAIDGPYNNTFDNTRAVLWTFRKLRRAVLIVMLFSVEWLSFPNGVLPNEATIGRSFRTTFKVVGQTNINNTIYVICQGNFGQNVGNRGFFYLPRGIFNLYIQGDPCVFLDADVLSVNSGNKLSLCAARFLPSTIIDIVENSQVLHEVFNYIGEFASNSGRTGLDYSTIQPLSLIFPPSLYSFSVGASRCLISHTHCSLLRTIRELCLTDGARSLLLFYLVEVLGPKAVEWFATVAKSVTCLPPFCSTVRNALCQGWRSHALLENRDIRWNNVSRASCDSTANTVYSSTSVPDPERKKVSTKRTPRQPFRKENPVLQDTFDTELKEMWAVMRRELVKKKQRQQKTKLRWGQLALPMVTYGGEKFSARGLALEPEAVPASLIGQPWCPVGLCSEDGVLTGDNLFFIKDHVCCFNVENRSMTIPLQPMCELPIFQGFPFIKGFDSVFNSPNNPCVVYFICGEMGQEWDACRQRSKGDLFKLRFHRVFRSLPEEFLTGINLTIPVPNSSLVFFFSQLRYIIFDLEAKCSVGGVLRIGEQGQDDINKVTFGATLSNLFPNGPMAAMLLWGDKRGVEEELEETHGSSEGPPRKRRPVTGGGGADLSAIDGNGVHDGFEKERPASRDRTLMVLLIAHNGRLAIVKDFTDSEKEGVILFENISLSALSRLPLAFRQSTVAALDSICRAVLDRECEASRVSLGDNNHVIFDECVITSTFTQKCDRTHELLSLVQNGAFNDVTPLLCDSVVFVQTEESLLSEPPQFIEIRYPDMVSPAYGALVLVLDVSCVDPRILRIAPVEAVIESSDDGFTYVEHTQIFITGAFTAVCWGVTHVGSHWRLRFVTNLPVGVGIVRMFFYEVSHALETVTLEPVVPQWPLMSTSVSIEAPQVFFPAEEILSCLTPGTVFMTPTSSGWFERHCVLPILPDGNFCLLFCGTNFVELDCISNTVVNNRALSLTTHPAFSALPLPFSRGFNAAFYPVAHSTRIVVLVHGGHLILWDIDKGSPPDAGAVPPVEGMFKDLPWKMDEVEAIVQIWNRPTEVFMIKSPWVLRWDFISASLVEGPMTLSSSSYFRHAELGGKAILCATSFPSDPRRFYVFSEDCVAVQSDLDVVSEGVEGPKPVSQTELFHPATWYLEWGKRRHDCVINVDLKYEQKLVVGLEMQSSEPCDDKWIVDCSNDGLTWKFVDEHLQSSGCCKTIWGFQRVGHCSRRLWRFTLQQAGRNSTRSHPAFYFHITLFTLPVTPYRSWPVRIAHSGTLNGPSLPLFVDEKAVIAFENTVDQEGTTSVKKHHITVDYGESNPPDIMEFSCVCPGRCQSLAWVISCSINGEQWEDCGRWYNCGHRVRLAWQPRGPRRFWAVGVESQGSSIICESLSFFEYVGSSLYLGDPLSLTSALDPFLLSKENSYNRKATPVKMELVTGTTIILDNKLNGAQIVGVRMIAEENRNPCATFVAECSSDAVHWHGVGTPFALRGSEVHASWEAPEICRYWRLRLVQHIGSSCLKISGLYFDMPKPTLYRQVEPAKDETESKNPLELNLRGKFIEIVAVEAELPPGASFTIEKRSFDGSSWEPVAVIRNNMFSTRHKIRQGWRPRGISSHWRLQPIVDETNVSVEEQSDAADVKTPRDEPDKDVRVEWFAFNGKSLSQVNLSLNPAMEMSVVGFDEMLPLRYLFSNALGTVVLRSIPGEAETSVAFFFDGNYAPVFRHVVVRGRVVANPTPPFAAKVSTTDYSSSPSSPTVKRGSKRSAPTVSTARGAVTDTVAEEHQVVSVIVETSNNGVDYVPVAERDFSSNGNSLSFLGVNMASHWRVRFKGIPRTRFVELTDILWFNEKGVTTNMSLRSTLPLSDSMYETWQSAAFNHEEEFCRRCREGYDQARSVSSGLREPNDIERHGLLAQKFVRFRKEYIGFQSGAIKEYAKSKNLPEDKFITVGKRMGCDFMYLLHAAAQKYSCDVDKLNQLIASPMLVGSDLSMEKETLSWFYPKLLQGGTLAESFYGFHKVSAYFMIFWSMSLHIQRNNELLTTEKIKSLSPHVASVLVVVDIKENNWVSIEHFPQLPFLYHVGFSGQQVAIAFTLNSIVFTPKYRLAYPGGNPLPVNYNMQLLPGVNFIRRASLTSCPCPIFDLLHVLYSPLFLNGTKTEIILAAPSMCSNTATVRFTLPGNDINFGLQGLRIGHMVFEVELFVKEAALDTANYVTPISEDQRINFVTYDTLFKRDDCDVPALPLTLAGSIGLLDEQIVVSGVAPNARYELGEIFRGAFIGDLNISFSTIVRKDAEQPVEPSLALSGTLVVPECGSYFCRLDRAVMYRHFESMTVELAEVHLTDLVTLTNSLAWSSAKCPVISWARRIPMFFSVEIQINPSELRSVGCGTVKFGGSQGDVKVVMSPQGFGAVAKLSNVRTGGICLHGRTGDQHVTVSVASSDGSGLSVWLDGYCVLFASEASPTRVEISQGGVMCVATGVLYDVCIEEDSLFPSGMYAQVVVSKELLSKCLEETLRTQPIIVALTANGVAFSLLVDDVLVSDSILDRQVIFITVRGVFMGGCFDVTVPAVQPDNTVDEAKRICEMLVPRIIEQSDTQLWTLHHMFVGSVDSSSPASPIRGDAGVKSEGSVQKTPSVEICAPLLPKETISSGCEGGFQESWADREKIMLDGNFWV